MHYFFKIVRIIYISRFQVVKNIYMHCFTPVRSTVRGRVNRDKGFHWKVKEGGPYKNYRFLSIPFAQFSYDYFIMCKQTVSSNMQNVKNNPFWCHFKVFFNDLRFFEGS